MEYRERIEAKVGILFEIANQYLTGQTSIEKAKELINREMVNIRPAQFEAMKSELGERLKKSGSQASSEKLFELFKNYISPPYNKLPGGHPLRNYFEENGRVRSCLLRIDEMEGQEVELEVWQEIYELLSEFRVHINRQEKHFYPRLIPMDMHLQIEKAKEIGNAITGQIDKNCEDLNHGNMLDFLLNQRSLSQLLMDYLDLEERVLYPKALISFTDCDFTELRRIDDIEGYAFIEYPEDYVPKEKPSADCMPKEKAISEGSGNIRTDLGLILPAVLAAKQIGVVYYTLSGEMIYTIGDQITETDLSFPEETRRELLNGICNNIKYHCSEGKQTFLITYSAVKDSQGKNQGLLKTKENISDTIEFSQSLFT